MNAKIKTAILISGGGSNMEALIKAAKAPNYPAEISVVISNTPDAGGLDKAKELGIPTLCINHKSFKSRAAFEHELDRALREHHIELICNAGFMRLLTAWFVGQWSGRQLNIHPSLLPKFKGLHTHKRILEAGEKTHGCTIHYVDEGMDTGTILEQKTVKVLPNDTPETLGARVLVQEHLLYPQVLKRTAISLLKH